MSSKTLLSNSPAHGAGGAEAANTVLMIDVALVITRHFEAEDVEAWAVIGKACENVFKSHFYKHTSAHQLMIKRRQRIATIYSRCDCAHNKIQQTKQHQRQNAHTFVLYKMQCLIGYFSFMRRTYLHKCSVTHMTLQPLSTSDTFSKTSAL